MAPDTTTGRHPPQRREARFAKRRCALHPGGLLPGCKARRPRRDRGGATGTGAGSQGFGSGMEAHQGGDSFAGSVHDSPPRQGDARKRHRQKKNKTDSNQSSRKKKNSSSSRNIISNRQMTDLKRQKPTAECPRNVRGGASARPLSAPPARGLFPARADGHLSSRLPGVFKHADE